MKKGNLHKRPSGTRGAERKSATFGFQSLMISSGIGAAFGGAAFVIFVLLFSALSLCFDNPHVLIVPLCFFAVLASCFLGGLVSQRKLRSRALLGGAVCGSMLFLMFCILSLTLRTEDTAAQSLQYILKALVLPLTCLGAIVGASPKKNNRKHKKRK